MLSPASDAVPTRMSSVTGHYAQAIPPTLISCIVIMAIAPAITARLPLGAPRRRWWMPISTVVISWTLPSIRLSRESQLLKLWPKAEEFGFPNEEAAFALQYGHGVGLAIWEKPIFSRLVSLDHTEVIEEGMVFALETFWPASDGWSAARIEEQLVVTKDGCEVITRFPAEQLLVAGTHYYTVNGQLAT